MDSHRIATLQTAANSDPEFRLAARFWNMVLRLHLGEDAYLLHIKAGQIAEVVPWQAHHMLWVSWDVSITASADEWAQFLAPIPQPFYQDLWPATIYHGFTVEGNVECIYPYYPALRRLFDLMRAMTHTVERG